MASNMTQRVLFALVAIPLVLLVLWQGGIALVFLFITRYFFKFSRKKNV